MSSSQLDYDKACREVQSLLGRLDKGELQDLMDNEEQLNEMIENMDAVRPVGAVSQSVSLIFVILEGSGQNLSDLFS